MRFEERLRDGRLLRVGFDYHYMISLARAGSRNIDTTRYKYNPGKPLGHLDSIQNDSKHETYPVVPQRLVAIHAIERYHPQTMDDELVRKHRGVHFDLHDVDGWITPIQFKSDLVSIAQRSSD